MSSQLRSETIPGGGQIVLAETANFLMLVQTAAAVDVTIFRDGGSFGAKNVEAGYVKGLVRPWARATIKGTPGALVRFLIGHEEIAEDFTDYRRTVGVFQEQPPESVDDIEDVDVGGSAVAVEVLPANDAHYSRTVQNHHDSIAVIRVGGPDVSATRGIRLVPGQSQTFRMRGALYAIRETAAPATVCVNFEVG